MDWNKPRGSPFAVIMLAPDESARPHVNQLPYLSKFQRWARRAEAAVRPLFAYFGKEGSNLILVRVTQSITLSEIKYPVTLEGFMSRWDAFLDLAKRENAALFAELDTLFD
jgi:hypothetical protein